MFICPIVCGLSGCIASLPVPTTGAAGKILYPSYMAWCI